MGIIFPRAFAFAVDDLGWNDGSDLSQSPGGGPYRCGVKRHFEMRDYKYLVEVGIAVGARIQCLFILSEMDRGNILGKFPTTTYQRENWNNSFRVSDEQVHIMNYVRDHSSNMEFGLHGIGHEYWAQGQPQKRAEWYNLADREPWPEKSVSDHIQCFADIMDQYGLNIKNGHSFPESFVPCAYSYYWNPGGAYSLGKLLSNAGVKYANTDFSQIPELNPPIDVNGGGFDNGVHVINRLNYGNLWYELSKLPETTLQDQETDVIESHWPNWLAQDDFLQPDITKRWIDYYSQVQSSEHRYIAKNTEQLHSQWLYNHFTRIIETTPGKVTIDNRLMPGDAYANNLLGNLVLKLKLDADTHINHAVINNEPIAAYFEDAGYAFLYIQPLQQEVYDLTYSVGSERMSNHAFNDGTYNVYSFHSSNSKIELRIRMYGEQIVKVKCKKPAQVNSKHNQLDVKDYNYDEATGYLNILLKATDMQGSTGIIEINF